MLAKVKLDQPITNQTDNFCDCVGKLSISNNKRINNTESLVQYNPTFLCRNILVTDNRI